LRFPRFEGEWKECLLGSISSISKGAGISKDQLSEEGKPCILYGELYTRYKSEVINNVLSRTDIDASNLVKSEANDVIIPSSGESAVDISTACCVPFSGILLGGDLNIIRLYTGDGRFLSYQLNGKRKYDIAKVAQGVSVVHLYGDGLKKLKVYSPTIEEQHKIATLLSLIDERISTQIKIIQRLESLMKTLNNRMICRKGNSDPELRFSDFSEEWEHTTIKNILQIGSGRDYKHLNEGDSPVFGTGGYMASVDSYLYDGQTVFIGRKGTINKPFFFEGKFWTVDTLFYTHSFCNVLPRFCFYIFNAINWLEYNEASGVPSLSKTTIESIDISIPSLPEQEKIATLLSLVDDKIKTEKSIIHGYQRQKKHLLAQLFI
jgi:type I restriction enzyme S subunit